MMRERDEDRSTHPGTGLERRFWTCGLFEENPAMAALPGSMEQQKLVWKTACQFCDDLS
jgi:hypothetical protein